MIFGLISVIGFNVVDTFFISKLGTTQLAAMGFIYPVVFILSTIALGLGAGAASIISRSIGRGDFLGVKKQASHSLYLSLIIVTVLIVIGMNSIDPLFTLLGANERVLVHIRSYMSIWYIGMFFLVVPMVGNSILRASGNTIFPGLIMATSAVINIILDPILIFGTSFIAPMGMEGAAIATVFARAITMAASIYVLYAKEEMLEISVPRWSEVKASWAKLLKIGLPAAGTNMIAPATMAVITRIVADQGDWVVASLTIVGRLEVFSFVIIIGLSSALVPFVGQNIGANNFERVNLAIRKSTMFCVFFGITYFAAALFLSEKIPLIFSNDPKVIQTTSLFFLLVPISYAFEFIRLTITSALLASGKPILSGMLSLLKSLVFGIPVVLVLNNLFQIKGVFLAIAFSNICTGIIAVAVFRRVLKQLKEKRPPKVSVTEPILQEF